LRVRPCAAALAPPACIDGRIHPTLTRFVLERHHVDAVDLITEPGVDGALAEGDEQVLADLLRRLAPSRQAHAARVVVVAGHEDCAAMPGGLDDHRRAIRAAVKRLREAVDDGLTVEGALVRLDGTVEDITDATG
jgi:hypothetical protein